MSLSDKIYREFGGHLYKEDVKQFIKRIDKKTDELWTNDKYPKDSWEAGHKEGWNNAIEEIWEFIKEEAGKKLLEEKGK